jgi:acyl-[acyl-carrier-protein] desaturase
LFLFLPAYKFKINCDILGADKDRSTKHNLNYQQSPGRAGAVESLLSKERIEELIGRHNKRRELQFRVPDELLFPGNITREARVELLQKEAAGLSPAAWSCIGLNSLTEVALPYYHLLLATTSGVAWLDWSRRWTAEEKRHDDLLHNLLRLTGKVIVRELEHMQYRFLLKGFEPEWHGEGELLVFWYTVFQEQSTQVSYSNLVKLLNAQGARAIAQLVGYIAGEEGAHAIFYQEAMDEMAPMDHDRSLLALLRVLRRFTMPGRNVPGFKDLSFIAERAGMFGGGDFLRIFEGVSKRYNIEGMQPKGDAAKRAQETLLTRLEGARRGARKGRDDAPKLVTVPFLEGSFTV